MQVEGSQILSKMKAGFLFGLHFAKEE